MLSLPLDDARRFVEAFKGAELKKQVTITCLAKMNKSSPDEDAINCLIVGTEQRQIYILDCEAFTILTTVIFFFS
jgi:Bardet-Biedl syndrome 1 protein